MSPSVVGVLAGQGNTHVRVHRAPKVALVSTGNEIVAPGTPLKRGQIYDSNAAALAAALTDCGIPAPRIERLRDDPKATLRILKRCLAESEVLLTIGGVSVGEHDLVKGAAAQLGVEQVFWQVAVKPGKPIYFGTYRRGRGLFFGLPGNPVAAMLCFAAFVKPALNRTMGLPPAPRLTVPAVLARELKKKPGRLEWVRVLLSPAAHGWLAEPVAGQGSHMLGGLAQAQGLVTFPADETRLPAGHPVEVTPLM